MDFAPDATTLEYSERLNAFLDEVVYPAETVANEQIQANVAGVGFELVLEPMDLGAWYTALGNKEYEAVSAPLVVAIASLATCFNTSEKPGPAWSRDSIPGEPMRFSAAL